MKFRYLSIAFAGIALLAACSSEAEKGKEAKEEAKEEIPVVKVEQVSTQNVEQVFTYTATTEADKINNISSSMPLRIKNILVDEGQNVSAGQRVVVLDDVNTTSYELQLSNAEAKLRNDQVEYNRAKQLLEIGGGTKQQVDMMALQLETDRNNVASARRALENASENRVLTSPVNGVVTARNYDPGDMTGSLPILTIAQVRPLKTMINVSETEYSLIRTGMKVELTFDTYGEELFTGTISKIMPSVDPNTRTFGVEITLPNTDGRILPGMFGRATLTLGEANHIVVPDLAVVKQQGSGDKYIYTYDPQTQTVDFVKVELGQRLGSSYEVLSGIEPGTQVVVSGQNGLTGGKKVKLQK
ncbi:MAG: efflux RND transporter periplasmic adaptor subunit [Prevotella sp.]|nr:efflux RND transporter periplasmic adaptor subunit [Prevotella sp.]MCM1074148.1 efflux RND transporter periplasmic adaptor subunit [Ruminococcus sp.]